MNNRIQLPQLLRNRKALLILPLLVFPFITMLFWALGGGSAAAATGAQQIRGLNAALPDAQPEEPGNDKLSLYNQAEKDSSILLEQMQNDPYYKQLMADSVSAGMVSPDNYAMSEQELAVNERLAALSSSQQTSVTPATYKLPEQQLQSAMNAVYTPDPEMQQLNGMLDKILDIQNPGRNEERLQAASAKNKKQVFTIAAQEKANTVELLGARQQKRKPANEFLEWNDGQQAEMQHSPSVTAIVQETRTLTAGASIKLRLLDAFFINGMRIPEGQFIYGVCSISDDRMAIHIPSIRYRETIFPVSLTAYDMDGLSGVYIPGGMGRDVAKNTAGDAAQGVDIYAMDNSLTTQAASVGVKAAKSLLSKKARQVKVTVKAGYRLLLKDATTD